MSTVQPHKIIITPLRPDNRGQPYSVSFNGKTIIPKSYVPSHDACRYLVSHGLSGPAEIWGEGELFPRLKIRDIVKAAKWTVSESASKSVRFTKYVPLSETDFGRQLLSGCALRRCRNPSGTN